LSEKRTPVTPELEHFLTPFWEEAPPLVRRILEDIHNRGKYPMQISLEQANVHGWLCRLIGARRVLEVGTYLGLSAAAFALSLPDDGHVDTIEVEPEHADIAEGWFRDGGIADKITVHRGPALEVVSTLSSPYDVCFLDGAKRDNPALLDLCIERMRSGGLIMVDNAFQDGAVVDSDDTESAATRKVLEKARSSPELDPVLLPVADGLLVCRRL
jgi:caffeoyl-CoA O-methyltransferase